MSDSSDEEDSISKIDFSVISMAIEAGHKMVQQILNCVHYGTPEVRNLMYNECDFIVECRVCRNLFRSIPNFVAHKRIYCTAEFEPSTFPSSGQEESVVVVQPMDTSPGQSSGSVSPMATASTSSSQSVTKTTTTTKSTVNTATPTGSVNNAKSVLSSVFSSSTLSQSKSRTAPQSKSSVNVSVSNAAGKSTQEQAHCRNQGQGVQGLQGQDSRSQSQDDEKKEDEDSSDGDTSTLKQLLTGKFKGKSSEYNFYSRTAEKMERERRAKEVCNVVMTPIPTNRNAAYLTVTKGGTANDALNVAVSLRPDSVTPIGRENSSLSIAESVIGQNRENTTTGNKNIDTELKQGKVPERSSKRKNSAVQKIVNEEPATEPTTSKVPENTLQMEQKNKKFVRLRPVKSQLGSHQYSELSELGLLGHCDLAMSKCLLCSLRYSSRKSLLQHMHSIHSGRKILFPCSMCEKKFSYFWGLTRHLQNNHNLSKEKIDKIRDKLKSMAYDTADLEQEELMQKEQSDSKSRVASGQSSEGSKQEKTSSVKQTPDLVQTGFVPRIPRGSETAGIKLNKCDGCKRAFWKKSNYDDHVNQCKWLVSSTVKIDKPSTNSRSTSRSTSRSRSESSNRDVPTLRTTETSQNRPSTRSKVMDKDVVNIASSNVMDNLESIERRARSRTRSKVTRSEHETKQQSDPPSEKGQTGRGTGNKQRPTHEQEAMENDREDSRDGSEISKSSSIDRIRHKEKTQDQKSPVSSPSKRSDSSSPNTPSKQQIVTRHLAKSSEAEAQYMRTRFFDKRRESQIRPDRSPQSVSGSEASSPTLQKKDGVKIALGFEGVQDGRMNKPRDRSGSGSRGTTPSTSPGKDRRVLPLAAAGSEEHGQKSLNLRGKADVSQNMSRIDDKKSATKSSRDSSLEGPNDRSVSEERSEASYTTRAGRESSRDSLKETSSSRPSTRSVQRTVETTKDGTKSQTAPTSSKRDGRKSSTEGTSRDSSRESLKDSSSRVGTRSGSASAQPLTDRSRSRDSVESSPVLAKKDRQNSPVGKDIRTSRDGSTENVSDRSSSRTRTRHVPIKKTDTSRSNSKDRISSRISTRNTSSLISDEQKMEQEQSTRTMELDKIPSENMAKVGGGAESEQHSDETIQPSLRKSYRVGMKTDKKLDHVVPSSETLKGDGVSRETREHDTTDKTNLASSTESDSCPKLGGIKSGVTDRKSTGIDDGNVARVATRRSRKVDTKIDNISEKHCNTPESQTNQSNRSPASEIETDQSDTSQSMVTRRSLSNISGQTDIPKSSNTRSYGSNISQDLTLKETRSSGARKTDPNKASGNTKEGEHGKGENSNLNKNEGLEFQKRSSRIREKVSTRKEDESVSKSKESPQSPRKRVDEVDGESSVRSTRLASASRMKAQKATEDVSSQPTEIQVGSMIISSMPPENQSFLGLKVTPYTRKSTSKASSQFTPRIPKCLSTSDSYASNTVETISDSQCEEPTALETRVISNTDDRLSDSDGSSVSSVEETDSDLMSASPEPEVQLFEEIWVQKEPGQPSEEVKSNAYAMMTYKSSPTPSSSKGPSSHATRASEKMRTTRTQMYVTDPKNIGTSQESVQTRCLDLSRIAYLSDEKEMKCLQCGLGFSCLSNLRRHVVRHLGWRRYKCKLCKFSSYNKSECNTHLIRSHGTKARNCTASTLIIDLNKEAAKARSQKKINTIKSKTTGPSLRSRSPRKTSVSESKETASLRSGSPRKTSVSESKEAEEVMTDPEQSGSKKVSPVVSKHGKTRKGESKKESVAANRTRSSDQSGSAVVSTRSRKAKDNVEESLSTKKGEAVVQSDADAAANLQMKTEELRRTRKRKRSYSGDTNSSKVEINKGEVTVSVTKKSRKRKRSNSVEGCTKEEEAASNKSAESLVVPIKKKYEMKRSTSLDGTCSNLQEDVGETLSDSWDIPSVSDFENSDTEMVCSPPIAKVVPNLETMMAALEEAKAFKFVRQRGKGRRSLPLVKKTQRSGSLGSHADSHVDLTTNTASTSSVEGTKTQTNVLELSGVSSASLGCEGDTDKCIESENVACTSSREKTDENLPGVLESSSGAKESSLSTEDSSSGVKDSSSGVQESSSSVKESSSSTAVSSSGVHDSSSGVKNNSLSTGDSSSSVKDSSLSTGDSSSSVKDSSSVVQESSSSVKDSSLSTGDSSSSVKDSSLSTGDSSSSVKDSSSVVQESSSSVKDSSLSTGDSSSSVKDSSSVVQESSSNVKDSSLSTGDSSSSVKDSSSVVQESSSSVKESSLSTGDSSSSVKDSLSVVQESSSSVKESSLSTGDSSSSVKDSSSVVQESSSSVKESSSSTEDSSSSGVLENITSGSNTVQMSSCSNDEEHSMSGRDTNRSVVDQVKSSKMEENKSTETVKEISEALHNPVAEESTDLAVESSQVKDRDIASNKEDSGDKDVSVGMVTKTVTEDADIRNTDVEKQKDGNSTTLSESKTVERDAS